MKKIFLGFIFFLISFVGLAQVEEQVLPTDLKQLTVITEPATLYKGFLRTGMIFSYNIGDRIFTDDGDRVYAPENGTATTWDLMLTGQYGITDRLEVVAKIPFKRDRLSFSYILEAAGLDTSVVVKNNNTGFGLGDLGLGVNYQLLTENESRPAIVARFNVSLPTGEKNPTNVEDQFNYDLPTGDGEVALAGDIWMRRINYPFSYTASIGYVYFFEGEKIFEPEGDVEPFRSGPLFNAGGSFNFHLNEWLAIENDLTVFISGDAERNGVKSETDPWSLQYLPRINFQIKRFRLVQVITIPLAGQSTGADIGYILLLQYVF